MMEEQLFAHIAEDGRIQTVTEHLEHTAELSGRFAGAFGAAAQGWLMNPGVDAPRAYGDYTVTVDEAGLPDGISCLYDRPALRRVRDGR